MKTNNIILVLVVLFCIGCDDPPPFVERVWSITIVNTSDNWIYVSRPSYSKEQNQILEWNLYPDTTLPVNEPSLLYIQPNSENYIDYKVPYEEVFQSIPSGTLSIFIFDKDSVDILGWEHIRENYKVLKRNDYTYQEYQQSDWTIFYP